MESVRYDMICCCFRSVSRLAEIVLGPKLDIKSKERIKFLSCVLCNNDNNLSHHISLHHSDGQKHFRSANLDASGRQWLRAPTPTSELGLDFNWIKWVTTTNRVWRRANEQLEQIRSSFRSTSQELILSQPQLYCILLWSVLFCSIELQDSRINILASQSGSFVSSYRFASVLVCWFCVLSLGSGWFCVLLLVPTNLGCPMLNAAACLASSNHITSQWIAEGSFGYANWPLSLDGNTNRRLAKRGRMTSLASSRCRVNAAAAAPSATFWLISRLTRLKPSKWTWIHERKLG